MTTAESQTTATDIVGGLPWRWRVQGVVFLIGGLGFMFDGWDVVINAYLIPLMAKDWSLTTTQAGLIATVNLIGMAIGAVVWGSVADLVGRKAAFSWTLLIFGGLSVAGAAAPSYHWFLLIRLLAGVGLGGCVPVDYAMVSEFMPNRVRGRLLTAMDVWWPIGGTCCGLVCTALVGLHNWRVLLLVMVLPALMVFWVRRSIPESPLYLSRSGRADEARTVITDLVARTGAQPRAYAIDERPSSSSMSIGRAAATLRELWSFDWRVTAVSWALFSTVLLQYYGALIWLPTLLKKTGYSDYLAFMVTTGVTAAGALGVLGSAVLVGRFGAKPVIAVSSVLAGITLVSFAASIRDATAAKLWIFAFGIAIEFAIPAIYSYVTELYPTRLRASGFGYASSTSRVVAALVPTLLGSLLFPRFGLTASFSVTAGLFVLAVVFMTVSAPETRGRILD